MSGKSGAPTKFIKPYGGRRTWKGNDEKIRGGIFYNAWIIKFVPGLVLGYLGKVFFDKNKDEKKKLKTKMKAAAMDKGTIDPESKLKMVLVVNVGLSMGTGKIAAQCGHATLGGYKKLAAKHKPLLKMWEMQGQAKIVLKCKDKEELLRIDEHARANNLPTHLVSDAGHTEIAAGSLTVCAIGPAPAEAIDMVTSRLKLLS